MTVKPRKYPRFFIHTGESLRRRTSNALYVRFNDATSDPIVYTVAGGRRKPNHSPFPVSNCEAMVAIGQAKEITAEQAKRLRAYAKAARVPRSPRPENDSRGD